jgi:GNAT superfamily N-acetyltransferase
MNFGIVSSSSDDPDVDAFIEHTFNSHSLDVQGVTEGWFEWGFAARDAGTGRTVAVIMGESYWGGLLIDRLVVAPEARHAGIGSHLLLLALQYARCRGCSIATLQTFDYQAPEFYKKFGFCVDFTRHGFRPQAGAFHYFSRGLAVDDADATSFDMPLSSAPEGGGCGEVGSSTVTFTTRAGSTLTIEDLASREGGRAEALAFTRVVFKEHAMSLLGTWAESGAYCYTAVRLGESAPTTHAPGCESIVDASAREILGVVSGRHYWGGLFVSILVVSKEARGSGLGTKLLQRAVQHAVDSNCKIVCVESFGFQAPGFYARQGFVTDFVGKGWSRGLENHYLSLQLPPLAPSVAQAAVPPLTE